LFVNPMKTPCCGKTYCNDCIENALLESDLTCPGCETENVSLERLEPDTDVIQKIKEYESEKSKQKASSPYPSPKSPGSPSRAVTQSPSSDTASKSKKRTASDVTDASQSVAAPAMKRQKSGEPAEGSKDDHKSTTPVPMTSAPTVSNFMPPDMNAMMQSMSMPGMPFPMMSMPGMPFMPMPGMMNPMMGMPNFPNFNMANGMNGMQFPNMMPNNFTNNMNGNYGQNQYQNQNFQPKSKPNTQVSGLEGVPTGPRAMTQGVPTGPKVANQFANQQRYQGREEDNAYMRQPVNPHRHQGKGKRGRPREADYREL
jgi:protein MPE1